MCDMVWGGTWFGWIFWLLILALIVWTVVDMRKSRRSDSAQAVLQSESPLDILKKRYARGEITKEQFQQMKKDIES